MKIDSNYKPSPLGGTAVATPRPAAPKPGSSAEVTLSAVAAHLAASDDVAPVDLARVKEIKEAIAEGRFQVNAGAIADSLIATARQLIESQRREG